MKNMKKNFVKIGLSLLIAAVFLLPVGVIGTVGIASNDDEVVGDSPDPNNGGNSEKDSIYIGGDNQDMTSFYNVNDRDISTPNLNWVANTVDNGGNAKGAKASSHSANGKNWGATFTDPSDMKVYTDNNGISFGLKPPAWAWTSTVDGNTITYYNSQNNVSVEYVISEGNVKETIILNQATPRNWVFKYTMQDLAGWEFDGHHIRMWKIENDLVTEYIIPKGNAWDSAGNTCDVSYECEQDPDNTDAFTVKLVLANSFISSATYPVFIDPTLSVYSDYFPVLRRPAWNGMGSNLQVKLQDFVNLDTNCKPFISNQYGVPLFRNTTIDYTHANTAGIVWDHDATYASAQCFNATSNFTLTGVSLQLRGKTNNYDNLDVWIAADNGGFPNNTTGGRLSNVVYQDWPVTTTDWVWLDCVFNNTVDVVNGSRYWVVMNCTGGAVGYEAYINTTNQYTDGFFAWQTKTDGVWDNAGGGAYDMNFRVYKEKTGVTSNMLPVGTQVFSSTPYSSDYMIMDTITPLLPKSEQFLTYALNNTVAGSGGTINPADSRNLILVSLYDSSGSLLQEFEYVMDAGNRTDTAAFEPSSTLRINVSGPSSTEFSIYDRNLKTDMASLGLDWDAFTYLKIRLYQAPSRYVTQDYLFNYFAIGNTLDTKMVSVNPADRIVLQNQDDYTGLYLTPLSNQTSYYHLKFENITISNLSVDDAFVEPNTTGYYNITGVSGDTQGIELRTKQSTLGEVRYDMKVYVYNSTHDLIGTEHYQYPSLNIPAVSVKDASDYILSSMKGQKYFGSDIELFNKNNMIMNATYTYVLKYQGVQIWRNETNLTNDNATTRQIQKYAALCKEGSYTLDTTISFVEYGKNRTYTLTDTMSLGKQTDVSMTDLASTLYGVKGNSLLTFTTTIQNNNTLSANYSENTTYYIVVNNNGTKTVTTWTDLLEGSNSKTLTLSTPATNYSTGFVDVKIYRKLYTSVVNNLILVYPAASVLNLTSLHGISGSDVFGVLLSSQNTTINEGSEPLTITTTGWGQPFIDWMTGYYWYVVGCIMVAAVLSVIYLATGKSKRGRN